MSRSTLLIIVAALAVVLVGVLVVAQDNEQGAVGPETRTQVEAPGTNVETDESGTRVQAPGVDIKIPKNDE